MKKYLAYSLWSIVFLLLFLSLPFTINHLPLTIYAQTPNPSLGPEPAGPADLEAAFSQIISVSVGLAFVALVFALVWGGIKYLISGGEAKAVQQARQTITWAILGIIFLIVAWLVLLLIEAFTGVKVTVFCINVQGCK